MSRYRNRFLFVLMLWVTAALLVLGFILGQVFSDFYVKTQQEQLMEDTNLVSVYMDGKTVAEIESYVQRVEVDNGFDLLVFNRSSEVIAGTPINLSKFNFRVPTSQVTQEGLFNESEQNEFIQFTKQISLDTGEPVYVSFIRYVNDMKSVYSQIWITIFIAIVSFFAILFFVLYGLTKQFTKPIDEASHVLKELAEGNYKARLYEVGSEMASDMLAHSINSLARNLERISYRESVQRARLESLIENIGGGLVLIDDRGTITLVNRTYREMFAPGEQITGSLYHGQLPSEKVDRLVEDVYLTEQPQYRSISVRIGFNRRTYMVSAAPIFNDTGSLRGTTLLFNDISELKKLEQMRKDFVANVSHELKTPLTSIRGFSETLLDGAKEVPEIRDQFLEIIQKEATRMQTLVEDLLELSRLEREDFQLDVSEVNLDTLVDEVCLVLSQKAKRKGIEIETNHDGRSVFKGDANRLKQVVLNLVANAVTYSPEGSRVCTSVACSDGYVHLIVSDNGIGIEAKELPRIFERFYRVDKARSRNSGGTGLGLAIVKHIVDLHGGDITVESTEGVGTTFKVKFPIA